MDVVKRAFAVLIDMLVVSVIFVPITMLVRDESQTLYDIVSLVPFGIILNKDALYGKSVGKRILGYVVISEENPASPLKCLIRNITFFIYPIEAIVLLFNPSNKRIGDYLVNTRVEKCPPSRLGLARDELKNAQFGLHSVLCFAITIIILVLIGGFLGMDTFSSLFY